MSEDILSRFEILNQYADGPFQLERILDGLSEIELTSVLTPNTWSIRQIAHHIVDGDDIWKTCIKAALGNQNGIFTLQWYWDKPQAEWADSWQYKTRSLEGSLALFRANRDHIVELLRLIPDAWEKSVRIVWPKTTEEERITVEYVLKMHADHALDHINDIRAIRQANNI
jgi:uncharacterized damage-inducible protein DinB